MKAGCDRSAQIEDDLDGLLPDAESTALALHVAQCPSCAAELAATRRVFHSLDSTPAWNPGPAFTERVLDAVLPSRIRRRWIRTVGWSYAGSLAASVVAALFVIGWPGTTRVLDAASTVASRHLVQLASFILNTLGIATLGVANGWGVVQQTVQRIAPLPRALGSAIQQPTIERSLWAAAVICAVLLVWLHRRDRSESDTHPLALVGV